MSPMLFLEDPKCKHCVQIELGSNVAYACVILSLLEKIFGSLAVAKFRIWLLVQQRLLTMTAVQRLYDICKVSFTSSGLVSLEVLQNVRNVLVQCPVCRRNGLWDLIRWTH
eukprot:Gb_07784 [translate_table: standard]